MNFDVEQAEARVRGRTPLSLAAYQRSQCSLAGGVSTALRRSAKPYPLFFDQGRGPILTDIDGNDYIDYTLAWGPLILGHSPNAINEAVAAQLEKGHTYGAQHALEYETAELLCRAIPGAELVTYANSGTEIVQVALRLARAVSGRPLYLKFEGHYHGWDDSVLVSYKPPREQSGALNPVAVGQGQRPWSGAVIARWNDTASVDAAFTAFPGQISAIICEPLLCNSGCIPAEPGFLKHLRETATLEGALLIFDEVITGFRLALGGAQEFYGVVPDLATYAKAAAGGLPLSILAGREEYMRWIADGRVVHAGTLNGNPLALAAAKATLAQLAQSDYATLHARGLRLRNGIIDALRSKGIAALSTGEGTCFQIHLQERVPKEYRDTIEGDKALYADFLIALLAAGVYALPDGRWYLGFAHNDEVIDQSLERIAAL